MQSGTGGSSNSVGVLFDIDGLAGPTREAAFAIIFGIADPELLYGCTFRDGEIRSTRGRPADRYCIRIEAPNGPRIEELRQALLPLDMPGLLPSATRLLDAAAAHAEPIYGIMTISRDGEISGDQTGRIISRWRDIQAFRALPSAVRELVARLEALNERLRAATLAARQDIVGQPSGPDQLMESAKLHLIEATGNHFITFAKFQSEQTSAERANTYKTLVVGTASAAGNLGRDHEITMTLLNMLVLVTHRMNGQPLPADAELDGLAAGMIETNLQLRRAMGLAKSGCFIATAAYGTDKAADVVRLRQLRDDVLVQSSAGRLLIGLYETISPPVADRIAASPVARRWTRRLVVRPARRLADLVLDREPARP